MDLQKYPFSEKFGWVEDKFGLTWQLNLAKRAQKITPFLLYVGQQGQAEEAMRFYTSVFRNSGISTIARFGKGEPGAEGTVKHAVFSLEGQEFMAMDGGMGHAFGFTEAISLFVNCETQKEVDELWEKFTAEGTKIQCGWLKDKFGVTWQIIPTDLGRMLGDKDPEKSKRVMNAMLKMDKLDIATLKRAYAGQ
jgi:predicted 3-demethylubiquinone-9 3-methyltransferase (glyoxalase superfamily)